MEEHFVHLLEEYFQRSERELKPGDVVTGVVVHDDGESYFVDLGAKTEALLPKVEASISEEGKAISIEVGHEVTAVVLRRAKDGPYILSVREYTAREAREEFERLFSQGLPLKVKVIAAVKGGYRVSFRQVVSAFLPQSQAKKGEELVGQDIKVLPLSRREGSFVVSQKAYLEREREFKLRELEERIASNAPLKGRVRSAVKGGFFIDFEGVLTGFIPFSELTHRRLSNPEEYLKPGDEVLVKVLSFDRAQRRLKASLKALERDPWTDVKEKFIPGHRCWGTVTEVKPFGVFVELEPGVEGLIPRSEVSWQRGLRPSDILKPGDRVEVVVLEVKAEEKRLILSVKRLEEDPWSDFVKEHSVGDVLEGKIKSIVDFGLFVEVAPGIDGFVHRSEATWKREVNLKEEFSEGASVKAKILELDPEARRLKLSLKALVENPWDQVERLYKAGEAIEGQLKQFLPGRGFVVELSPEVQALLPLKEVPQGEKLREGDSLKAKIILIDKDRRRVHLSLRALREEEEKRLAEEYMRSQRQAKSIKLGEVIKASTIRDKK